MKLYFTIASNGRPTWLGTQAEAKRIHKMRGMEYDQIDVPVDKEGLMAFLNQRQVLCDPVGEGSITPQSTPYLDSLHDNGDAETHETIESWPKVRFDDSAFEPASTKRADSRLWSSGPDIDAMCDAIGELDGHHLGNVTMAISCRLKALANA